MGHSRMRPQLWLWIVIPASAFTATPKEKEKGKEPTPDILFQIFPSPQVSIVHIALCMAADRLTALASSLLLSRRSHVPRHTSAAASGQRCNFFKHASKVK